MTKENSIRKYLEPAIIEAVENNDNLASFWILVEVDGDDVTAKIATSWKEEDE